MTARYFESCGVIVVLHDVWKLHLTSPSHPCFLIYSHLFNGNINTFAFYLLLCWIVLWSVHSMRYLYKVHKIES